MKKFLSKIMVFLILLTIIYIITAQTFHYLDLQVKGESGRMRYIHNELIADSIIMGSSRALHHYDPDILGYYYNVGEDRMGIIFSMGRLQLLKQRRMPHMLIYDVEPVPISPTCAPITTDQAYERFSGTWTPPSASRCSFLSISIIRGYSSCLPTGVIQP